MKSISEIDWSSLTNRSFTPSPKNWQSQVLYFLMVDRFSDGRERGYLDNYGQNENEGSTPPFTAEQTGNAIQTELEATFWREAGNRWCGGTLNGIRSKLGYLSRLGITTIWLSPVLKQSSFDQTMYHGYATQNFLEIDPHFGTKEDFQNLVKEAHQLNLFVILDIVVNHAGQVFLYDSHENSETQPEFNSSGTYPVKGWTDQFGHTVDININQLSADDALWPVELQSIKNFNCRGCIRNWEIEDQYLHGDFKLLKDFKLVDGKQPSSVIQTLTQIYQYWLAYADLDGYRLDAVKHMEPLATRYFVDTIHNFAKSIGKNNFYIIGEVAGGQDRAKQSLSDTGLDAALGILDIPSDLENMIKGLTAPSQYFQHVRQSIGFSQDQSEQLSSSKTNQHLLSFFDSNSSDESLSLLPANPIASSAPSNPSPKLDNPWLPNQIITLYDDHDQIRKNFDKSRFAAGETINTQFAFNVAATLVCTAGIPCLYYGSEQGFDGAGNHDRYIRECMFGGEFGAFRSKGYHFFNENHQIYQNLQMLLKIRHTSPALQTGQQQLLKISGDGVNFDFPTKYGDRLTSIIPWLRWTDDQIMLCAFSTDVNRTQTVYVKIPQIFRADATSNQVTFSNNSLRASSTCVLEIKATDSVLKLSLFPTEFIILTLGRSE